MTSLIWRPVYGDRGNHYADCVLGTFRIRTANDRAILSWNDVVVGNHGYLARAKRHAERLLDAFMRRQAGSTGVATKRKNSVDGLAEPQGTRDLRIERRDSIQDTCDVRVAGEGTAPPALPS